MVKSDMEINPNDLPDGIDALKVALRSARAVVGVAEARRFADQTLIADKDANLMALAESLASTPAVLPVSALD